MDVFKDFFEKNPNKILGEKVTTTAEGKPLTDAYGNPTMIIKGGLENLEAIDVRDELTPTSSEKVKMPKVSEEVAEKRMEEAWKKAEVERENKKADNARKPKKKKGKLPKLETVIFHDAHEEIDLFSFQEAFKNLNEHLNDDYVKVWVWYKKTQGLELSEEWEKVTNLPKTKIEQDEFVEEALKSGALCFDPSLNSFIPSVLYYAGNIYERLEDIENKWGADAINIPTGSDYQKQKQKAKLESFFDPNQKGSIAPLKLSGDESKRLVLSINSRFVELTTIVIDAAEKTVKEAFIEFFEELGSDERKYYTGDVWNVKKYFINRERFNEKYVGMTKDNFMRLVGNEIVFQMNRFCDQLPLDQREYLERKWNKEFNGFVNPNYDHIPVCFRYNKKFKSGKLNARPAQREGVAFIEAKGNGIVAFDVGVGKTMTAILAMAQALDNNECKRPLVIVPNPTLKKWISEIHGEYDLDGDVISHGIIPNYPLINIQNLGTDLQKDYFDSEKGFNLPIPEKSITICTYEALQYIGFSPDAESEHFEQLKEMLLKNNAGESDTTNRKRQAEIEALNEKIGIGQAKSFAFVDEIMWDYLVVDEAHNFSKVFEAVRGDNKESTAYEISQRASARGIKLFFLANYIQRTNNYRNICLLTATPFNNSPLEVYGMLSLTDYKGLKKAGVHNMTTFFDNFIDQTYETVVNSSGGLEIRAVIKGWTNKVALQKLIFNYMNYKSGEGNVERPNKHTLPKLNEILPDGSVIPLKPEDQVKTFLMPTERQKYNQREISKWLVDAMQDEDTMKGAHLKAATWSMANTLSPDLYEFGRNEADEDKAEELINLDPIDLIEESPKLKYTMECIKSVRAHHQAKGTELSNVIIYANRGVFLFHKIKEYLIEELGYKESIETPYGKFDQVEIIAGSGKGVLTKAKKEAAKAAFNEGYIKVIIGSQTIREGIDLQERTSVLFNLWCDWNPTDYKQLEGRAWRYGNMYKDVRIVTPLMVGGSDAFVWQKLEEKTGRINDIFDQSNDDNILDVTEEDREAIKWSLVEDVEELAKMMIGEEVLKVEQEIELLGKKKYEIRNAINSTWELERAEKEVKTFYSNNLKYIDILEIEVENKEDKMQVIAALGRNKQKVRDHIFETVKSSWEADSWISGQRRAAQAVREFRNLTKKISKAEDYVRSMFGEEYLDDMQGLQSMIDAQINDLKTGKLAELKSEANLQRVVGEIEAERKRLNAGIPTFTQTVQGFKDMNYLLDNVKDKDRQDPVIVSTAKEKEKPVRKKKVRLTDKAISIIPEQQLSIIARSEEFEDVREQINERVAALPKAYATDGMSDEDVTVYFRYFGPTGFEHWVYELQDGQFRAFSMIEGDTMNAESGYLDTEWIRTQPNVPYQYKYEIDCYWTPKSLAEVKESLGIEPYVGTKKKKVVAKKKKETNLIGGADQSVLDDLKAALEATEFALAMEDDPEAIKALEKAKEATLFSIEMEESAMIEII